MGAENMNKAREESINWRTIEKGGEDGR